MVTTSNLWKSRVKKLPKNLTIHEIANRFGTKYDATRFWLVKLNYPYKRWIKTEAHKRALSKVDPSTFDWSKANVVLARENNVSRERVRQLRNIHGQQNALAA